MQVENVMQQKARLQAVLRDASASLDKTTEDALRGWLLETILRLNEAAAPIAEPMPLREDSLWLSRQISSLELELQSV